MAQSAADGGRTFEFFGNEVVIHENRKSANENTVFGLTIWDCSIVLKNYFERKYTAEFFQNKRILELG
jgi:hypothetical protein